MQKRQRKVVKKDGNKNNGQQSWPLGKEVMKNGCAVDVFANTMYSIIGAIGRQCRFLNLCFALNDSINSL